MDLTALLLIASAGIMQASFVVPMKVTSKWEWENIWLAFCFLGFVALPAFLAFATVPHLFEVLATSSTKSIILAGLFGLGWGCGSVCFGLGVKRLGIGLSISIILGLTSSLGSIIPWITSTGVPLRYSLLLWLGVFVMLAGVVVCASAGQKREKALRSTSNPSFQGSFLSGLLICGVSGVFSSFMNLGFVYGAEITQRAATLGASATSAPNLLWLIIMSGGFVANASYCGYLLLSKESWRKYRLETAAYSGWAFVMASLWVGSLVAYGVGANKLGHLGPSVGWPVLMSLNIITSNVWGVATGEWRGVGHQATNTMTFGITILLLAVGIFAWASTMA